MKTLTHNILLITLAVLFLIPAGLTAQDKNASPKKKPSLQHWMTPEEAKLKHLIGKDKDPTDPPDTPVTNIAEFDRMQSVLIRYSFGISYQVIAAMSQHCNVTTIVASMVEETYVINQYQNQGVNTANCDFIIAPSDSYWTRDYGPWFIFDGNDELGVMDFTYNRPRPGDNAIPSKVAQELGINLFEMDIETAGGNYMTDGMGISSSSELIWEENPGYTHNQIAQIFEDYLGIQDYHVVADPNNTYIDHIDCWGKFLGVDKVLIREVPTSHAQYDEIEAAAAYYAAQTSSYGTPFRVFRVYTPNDQPYTNSLILNKRVFVPITGSQWDDDALASYEEAMPGYEVLGFTGTWQSTDALHCRAKGIADMGLLHIRHVALLGEQPVQADYAIEATIKNFSQQAIYNDSVIIYYRVNGAAWQMDNMTNSSGQLWAGTIPGAAAGSEIEYYLFAADESGRRETHPLIGEPDPHTFFVGMQAFPNIMVNPDSLSATAPVGGSDIVSLTISNIGEIALNFSIETNTTVYGQSQFDIPDSPSASSWDYNTYNELGWTELEIIDSGEIGGFEIDYTWQSDNYPEEGSFIVESPEGTIGIIAVGTPSGNYSVDLSDFNGEEMNGTWKIWIEDTYGDGGHQATNISVTITSVVSNIPWMPMDPPVTGTLNQNESIDVEITCNAYELEPGTHEGTVIIESNDPDNPVVEIPVTFVVTELADVTVTPDTLWFLTWNDMIEGKIVNISNQTASDITITEITEFGSNIFWILEPPAPSLPYVLTAGDELELTVVIPIPPSRGDFRDLLYDDMNITTEVGEHTVVVAWDSDLMSFSMTLTPDTLWFIDAGTIYMEQTVTVSNNSNMPFEVHEIQQNGTGANFGWYTGQISVTLPYFLMQGDEFTFDVNIDIPVDGSLVNLAYDSVAIYSDAGINYEMLVVDTDLISGMNVDYLSQPQIYPNPFTGHLTIDLSTYDGQRLSIDLIDMGGQLVASLCNNVLISGSEKLNWSSTSLRKGELETGIYFIRFTTGTDITLKKIIKVD